ncbi:rod shape-determining protein MreC [Adlercreutzia aquisgranensis]|uniref:rod shape-determining protein MreC n=1 Tax=Adlercreutzia aquisgranensis TaxID=2941323 RepID=UPI00203AA044|nr:rod shape-determining protein MreC [Adlercreutzia aquisgranensis]
MALNFQQRGRSGASSGLLALFLAVSLILVVVYTREGDEGPLHRAQATMSGLLAPVQMAGAPVGAATAQMQDVVVDATVDEESLSALREQNRQLIAQYAQGEEDRLEAERLRGLLGLKDAYEMEGVAARIIGRSTQAWSQTVTVDAGSAEGVDAGQTVMGATGVVGQVIDVADHSATVRLLTDPNSGAAAMVQSSRAEGIVRGSLEGLLYLEDVAADKQVSLGDVVITSGLGGSYVKGLIIGTVAKIDMRQGDSLRRIVVAANDAPELLEEVFVVFTVGAEDAAAVSASTHRERVRQQQAAAQGDGQGSSDDAAASGEGSGGGSGDDADDGAESGGGDQGGSAGDAAGDQSGDTGAGSQGAEDGQSGDEGVSAGEGGDR